MAEMTLEKLQIPWIKISKSAIGSFTENITNGLKNIAMSVHKLDFESFTKMKPKNHQKMALFDIFEIVDLEKFSKRNGKMS